MTITEFDDARSATVPFMFRRNDADDTKHMMMTRPSDFGIIPREPEYITEKLICNVHFPEQSFCTTKSNSRADGKFNTFKSTSMLVDETSMAASYSIRRDPMTGNVNMEDITNAYKTVGDIVSDLVGNYKLQNGIDEDDDVIYDLSFEVENLDDNDY